MEWTKWLLSVYIFNISSFSTSQREQEKILEGGKDEGRGSHPGRFPQSTTECKGFFLIIFFNIKFCV